MSILSQKTESRKNNFHFLRFLAASLVIISHTFAILGLKEPLLGKYDTYGVIGVYIFFIISGFLITKSWLNNPSFITYFKKRFLRIFPALSIVIMFAVFIVGPLNTTLGLKEYFSDRQTWSYLFSIFLFPTHYSLPGVFTNNPIINLINGPLWSLPMEILLYVFIAIIGMAGLLFKKKSILFFLLILIGIEEYLMFVPSHQYTPLLLDSLIPAPSFLIRFSVVIFFIMGSALYLYHEKIYLNYKFAAVCLTIFLLFLNTPYIKLIGYLTLPYLIIYFSYGINSSLSSKLEKYGDFSYGLYIFAWPIQQTLVHFWKDFLTSLSFFILTFGITLILAVLSCNLIEKPALSLKTTIK